MIKSLCGFIDDSPFELVDNKQIAIAHLRKGILELSI